MNSYQEVETELAKVVRKLSKKPTNPALIRKMCHLTLEAAQFLGPEHDGLAQQHLQRAIESAEILVRNNHEANLSDLNSDAVSDLELLASCYSVMASTQTGDPRAALDSVDRMLRALNTLAAANLQQPGFWDHIAHQAGKHGDFAKEHGDPRAASLYRRAIDADERLTTIAPDATPHYWRLAHRLADLAWWVRQNTPHDAEAVELMTRALDIRRQLVAADPNNPDPYVNLVGGLKELAQIIEDDDPARSLALLTEAATEAAQHTAAHPQHPMLCFVHADIHSRLADALWPAEPAQSIAALETCIESTRRMVALEPGNIAHSQALGRWLCDLAKKLHYQRQDEATKMAAIQEAYPLTQAAVRAEPSNALFVGEHAHVTTKLAEWIADDEPQRAFELLAEAEPLAHQLCAALPDHLDAVSCLQEALTTMAYHMAEYRPDHAVEAFDKALAVHERLTAAKPENIRYQSDRGTFMSKFGSFSFMPQEKALSVLEHAVSIHEWLHSVEPTNLIHRQALCHTLHSIANRIATINQVQALSTYDRAVAIAENALVADPGSEFSFIICGDMLGTAAYAVSDLNPASANTWFERALYYQGHVLTQHPDDHTRRVGYGMTLRNFAQFDNPTFRVDGNWQKAQTHYAAALQHLSHVVRQQHLPERVPYLEEIAHEVQRTAETHPVDNPDLTAAIADVQALAASMKTS